MHGPSGSYCCQGVVRTLTVARRGSKQTRPRRYRGPTHDFELEGWQQQLPSALKMSPPAEVTIPVTRRMRKSLGAQTDSRKAMDKENATVDVATTLAANRKKSRSKSMGPGGLDSLKQGSGNRRAV